MKTLYFFLPLVILASALAQEDTEVIPLLTNKNGKPEIINELKPLEVTLEKLEELFLTSPSSPTINEVLKRHTLKFGPKAVPVLVKVMKEDKFPEENRWHATMLLAQVMGKHAVPFIAKFTSHPHWMMRTAAFKALLGLGVTDRLEEHKTGLKDPSLIVRAQVLDNVNKLKLKSLGAEVWEMMFSEENYAGEKGSRKRLPIFKDIIKTLGDLEFEKAKAPLEKMLIKENYSDLKEEIQYAINKLNAAKVDDLKDLQLTVDLAIIENSLPAASPGSVARDAISAPELPPIVNEPPLDIANTEPVEAKITPAVMPSSDTVDLKN